MPTTFEGKHNFRVDDDWLESGGRSDSSVNPGDSSTAISVTAGTPGSFAPSGFGPDNITALRALGALGQTTAWTSGQYVNLENHRRARWDSDSWEHLDATDVTAGSPGSFSPTGALPWALSDLRSLGALGETGAWTAGQHVVLGNTTEAYWDGDTWEAGESPGFAPTGVTAGEPGAFTPTGANVPEDLDALIALGALGETTAWATDEFVELGDESLAHWDGEEWAEGAAPA